MGRLPDKVDIYPNNISILFNKNEDIKMAQHTLKITKFTTSTTHNSFDITECIKVKPGDTIKIWACDDTWPFGTNDTTCILDNWAKSSASKSLSPITTCVAIHKNVEVLVGIISKNTQPGNTRYTYTIKLSDGTKCYSRDPTIIIDDVTS